MESVLKRPKTNEVSFLKIYFDLTKFGIVVFVLLVCLAGYLMGLSTESSVNFKALLNLLGGVYFLASGSLALNQSQEWQLDRTMKRTQNRPIASGKITPLAGYIFSGSYILVGLYLLISHFHPSVFVMGLGTIIFYNGAYTLWWKKTTSWAAVWGAFPGALPVLIGYSATNQSWDWINEVAVFLFALLFLWQLPHFLLLAEHYQSDYAVGKIPILPIIKGAISTKIQIVVTCFLYIGLSFLWPLLGTTGNIYPTIIFFTGGVGAILLLHYLRAPSRGWFPLFLWVNLSILIYFYTMVFDRWYLILNGRMD